MQIREIMRPSWSVRADDTLWKAERALARRRHQEVFVLDAGQLVGVLSERDILRFREGSQEPQWWSTPVRAIMREVSLSAGPDEPASVAAERIAASPDAVLPVVERGFLIGVVTPTELLDAELRAWASSPGVVTASDVMTEDILTVAPTDPLTDAIRLMSDHQIRHLPVVDGALVGMLSERDLLPVADELAREDARPLEVRDAMTTDVTSVSADTSVAEISRTLVDGKIGAVPVVDERLVPIGIVSYVDVLNALAA